MTPVPEPRPRDALHALHLVEDFPPPEQVSGGAPIAVRSLMAELSRLCRVTVLAPAPLYPPLPRYAGRRRTGAPAETEPFPGVRVLRPRYLHLPLLWPLTTPLQLVAITLWTLWRQAPDAAVLHGHRGYPMGFVAVLAGRLAGRRAVWTAHGSDVHSHAVRGEARVRGPVRWALTRAGRVIAVSREIAAIAARLGVPAERVIYVPNGVDPERFPPRRRDQARQQLGLPTAGRLVLCVAHLVPVKGHAVLLRAWCQVQRAEPGARLALLGDGPLAAALEREAQALGLGEVVRFVGRVPHAGIPEWLAAADCLVLPSLGEGTPLAALEALAAGRPVVGTRVGGTAEVLDAPELGRLVPAGDAEALAQALVETLRADWNEEALRRRAGEFAWPRIAARVHAVYEEEISRHSRSTTAA